MFIPGDYQSGGRYPTSPGRWQSASPRLHQGQSGREWLARDASPSQQQGDGDPTRGGRDGSPGRRWKSGEPEDGGPRVLNRGRGGSFRHPDENEERGALSAAHAWGSRGGLKEARDGSDRGGRDQDGPGPAPFDRYHGERGGRDDGERGSGRRDDRRVDTYEQSPRRSADNYRSRRGERRASDDSEMYTSGSESTDGGHRRGRGRYAPDDRHERDGDRGDRSGYRRGSGGRGGSDRRARSHDARPTSDGDSRDDERADTRGNRGGRRSSSPPRAVGPSEADLKKGAASVAAAEKTHASDLKELAKLQSALSMSSAHEAALDAQVSAGNKRVARDGVSAQAAAIKAAAELATAKIALQASHAAEASMEARFRRASHRMQALESVVAEASEALEDKEALAASAAEAAAELAVAKQALENATKKRSMLVGRVADLKQGADALVEAAARVDEEELWTQHTDPATGAPYYVSSTGESSWDPPPGWLDIGEDISTPHPTVSPPSKLSRTVSAFHVARLLGKKKRQKDGLAISVATGEHQWTRHTDPATGAPYYVSPAGESSWEAPPGWYDSGDSDDSSPHPTVSPPTKLHRAMSALHAARSFAGGSFGRLSGSAAGTPVPVSAESPSVSPSRPADPAPAPLARRVKQLELSGWELWEMCRPKLLGLTAFVAARRIALNSRYAVVAFSFGMCIAVVRMRNIRRRAALAFALGLCAQCARHKEEVVRREKEVAAAKERAAAAAALAKAAKEEKAAAEAAALAAAMPKAATEPAAASSQPPGVPLTRAINWDTMHASSLDSTIWQGKSKSALGKGNSIDVGDLGETLVKHFAVAGAGGSSTASKVLPKSASLVTLLDMKLARNAGIALATFCSIEGGRGKRSMMEVRTALADMDVGGLAPGQPGAPRPPNAGQEQVALLRGQPDLFSGESLSLVRDYTGDPALLGLPERFLYDVVLSLPAVQLRLEVLAWGALWEADAASITSRLECVGAAVTEVTESAEFAMLLLDVILPLGNRLNVLARRGATAGFRLSSLPKLVTARATGGGANATFMRFVVEGLVKKEPHMLPDMLRGFPRLLGDATGGKVTLSLNDADAGEIARGLKAVNALLVVPGLAPQLVKKLEATRASAASTLASLTKSAEALRTRFDSCSRWLGEDPTNTPSEEFFSVLRGFLLHIKQELAGATDRAAREAKRMEQLAKKEKAGTASVRPPLTAAGKAAAAANAAAQQRLTEKLASLGGPLTLKPGEKVLSPDALTAAAAGLRKVDPSTPRPPPAPFKRGPSSSDIAASLIGSALVRKAASLPVDEGGEGGHHPDSPTTAEPGTRRAVKSHRWKRLTSHATVVGQLALSFGSMLVNSRKGGLAAAMARAEKEASDRAAKTGEHEPLGHKQSVFDLVEAGATESATVDALGLADAFATFGKSVGSEERARGRKMNRMSTLADGDEEVEEEEGDGEEKLEEELGL